MSWENPQLPEGVNYSHDNPLKELAILVAGALAVVVAVVLGLALAAEVLARQVPFAKERDWVAPLEAQLVAGKKKETPVEAAARQRLQGMLDRIAQVQGMPPDMTLSLHIVDDGAVNAFATLGGHVMVTRGMRAALPHENALVTVLAHEAAHVKHRDPLVAMGRGIAVMTALGVIAGVGDGGLAATQLQSAGLLTTLSFNRDQEREADAEALRTLAGWYGYTAGAEDLFEVLAREQGDHVPPAFLATHPDTGERIDSMRAARTEGPLLPLPAEVVELVKSAADGGDRGHE